MSGLTDVDHAVALAKVALDDRYDAFGVMEAGPDTRLEMARVAVYAAGPTLVRQVLRQALANIRRIPPGSYEGSGHYGVGVGRALQTLRDMIDAVEDTPPPSDDAPFEVLWWGEDSERLGCSGHVDLALFTAAARVEYLAEHQLFTPGGAQHIWLRPDAASDEHWEPCEADAEGALPFTVIDTAL